MLEKRRHREETQTDFSYSMFVLFYSFFVCLLCTTVSLVLTIYRELYDKLAIGIPKYATLRLAEVHYQNDV